MNISLIAFQILVPFFAKKQILSGITVLTAEAFSTTVPDTKNLSFAQFLEKYAQFTSEEVEKIENEESLSEVKENLYERSYDLGQKLRDQLGINSFDQALKVLMTVYGGLKIKSRIGPSNEILVSSCFFSKFYSKRTCQTISAIDAGFMAGLSDGIKLNFTQRITEGKNCCLAQLSGKKEKVQRIS